MLVIPAASDLSSNRKSHIRGEALWRRRSDCFLRYRAPALSTATGREGRQRRLVDHHQGGADRAGYPVLALEVGAPFGEPRRGVDRGRRVGVAEADPDPVAAVLQLEHSRLPRGEDAVAQAEGSRVVRLGGAEGLDRREEADRHPTRREPEMVVGQGVAYVPLRGAGPVGLDGALRGLVGEGPSSVP